MFKQARCTRLCLLPPAFTHEWVFKWRLNHRYFTLLNNTLMPNIDPNLIAAVDLNVYIEPDDKTPLQFLYGSQLYGTLFGISGDFQVKHIEGDEYEIQSVTLKLYNYKGVLNIGFTEHVPFLNAPTNIFFAVQGGSTKTEATVLFEKPIPIIKGESHQFRFNRILYPLPGFDDQNELTTNENGSIASPIPDGPLFDSEFEERNGTEHYKKSLTPGMKGFEGTTMDSVKAGGPGFPSARCHESNVRAFI